jgi:hypothetical protein
MTMLRKTIALGLCTFACLYSATPAQAAALRWTLDNVVAFDDDGTASGSFDFDAATSTYSNWNITTTSGAAILPAFTYNATTSGVSGTASSLTLVANPQVLLVNSKSANRQRTLTLDWLAPLAASGGIVGIKDTSEEIQNDNFVGKRAFINAGRFISSGAVTSAANGPAGDTAAVPTPMLLPGLVGMGIAAFRRRHAEAVSAYD